MKKTEMGLPPPRPTRKRIIEADPNNFSSKKFRKVLFTDQTVHGKHRTAAKRSMPHPVLTSFEESVDGYQAGAATTRSQKLQETFDALTRRLSGVDDEGDPVEIPGMPEEEDIEALELETETLTRPFDEETMTHRISHADGTKEVVDVKLGASMSLFAKRISQKRAEFDKLLSALNEIQAEIRVAREEIIRGEDSEVNQCTTTGQELTEDLRKILKDVESARDLTLSEVSSGRNEDQKLKGEATRKFQDLVNAFSS